jgi:hypothetical protein
MPLLYTREKKIFFAHVPKTGGTSVQDYLLRRFGSLALLGRHRQVGTRGTSLIISATHVSALDLEELLPPDLDWSFAVVRDPVRRLQSEYRFQLGASRASRLGFSSWLRTMIAAAQRDPRVYGNHIRPQVDLLPEETEVFRLEDGLEAIIPRLDAVVGDSAPDLVIGHLLKRKAEPIAVSREDARLIADYYSADYERFGYPRPDYDTFPKDPAARLRDLMAAPLGRAIVARQRRAWLQT